MDALRPAVVAAALGDEHPGVVRHAVRLCEGRFKDSDLDALVGEGVLVRVAVDG